MAQKRLKTTEEVAEMLSVSAITVQRMAANNEIPARKVAGRWRFDIDELNAWLQTNGASIDNATTEGDTNAPTGNSNEVASQLKRVGDRLDDINHSIRQVGKVIKRKRMTDGSGNE